MLGPLSTTKSSFPRLVPLPAGKEEDTEAQRGKQPAQCHIASETPESTLGPFLSWALTMTWQS